MPATLAYAPADPRRRWRFWRRLLIYPLVTGALAFLIPWLWHRVPLLYWQYKCQTYTAPPDQIIISSFPEDIERLKNDPNYIIDATSWTRRVVRKPPVCLLQFNRRLTGSFFGSTVAFLHARAVNGERHLVAITPDEASHDTSTLATIPLFGQHPIANRYSVMCTRSLAFVESPSGNRPAYFRVFAGQPDPADPAHFTIRVDFENHANQILHGYSGRNSVDLVESASPPSPPKPRAAGERPSSDRGRRGAQLHRRRAASSSAR